MKSDKGTANSLEKCIIARTSKSPLPVYARKGKVFAIPNSTGRSLFYSGIVCTSGILSTRVPHITGVKESFINSLHDGDILMLQEDGEVTVLWEQGSKENALFLTEACDCRCLMCPQPPQKHSESQFQLNYSILELLKQDEVREICLTGGEPTFLKEKFIDLLRYIQKRFPGAYIWVLTNGKRFAEFEFTRDVASLGLRNIIFCVSLHSDTSEDHDRIVDTPGSFEKTIRGILNLARFRIPIEMRFVINALNHQRLTQFSDFVYRNFPFAAHVALMGMEVRGYAERNFENIWVDPVDYGENLMKAAKSLQMKGMCTSIYNVPLCLLPRGAWIFARKSISAWKNDYLEECKSCSVRDNCCGVFTSSVFQSRNIKKIEVDTPSLKA